MSNLKDIEALQIIELYKKYNKYVPDFTRSQWETIAVHQTLKLFIVNALLKENPSNKVLKQIIELTEDKLPDEELRQLLAEGLKKAEKKC